MIILPTMSRDNQTMLNTRINNKCKDFVLTIEYISLRLSIRIFEHFLIMQKYSGNIYRKLIK